MENFGKRLKFLIKHSDIKSIRNLAKKTNFSTTSISYLINGHSKPSYEFLIALVDVFPDLDLNWLMTGESRGDLLALENKQLKEQVKVFETKLRKAVKPSSNRIQPSVTL